MPSRLFIHINVVIDILSARIVVKLIVVVPSTSMVPGATTVVLSSGHVGWRNQSRITNQPEESKQAIETNLKARLIGRKVDG